MRPFVKISPKDSLAAEMYRQEKEVALYLAKQVAGLLKALNGGNETDRQTIYDATHVKVARERSND